MPKSLKNKRVLEIGCGLGYHTECIIKRKANLISIDLAPMSVEITKRRLNIKKLNAKVLECDAENLPFADNYFDVVWSWGVIHHSPDTKKCSEEIERVLKKKGKLYIMLYNRNSMYNWINVIFRYGILQGKLFKMSIQELHNRYTDGKKKSGAPLSKYFTRNEVKNYLFPNFQILTQKCFEKKHVFSFWVPAKFRRSFEKIIPNSFHTLLWARLGFLLFTVAKKGDLCQADMEANLKNFINIGYFIKF